MKMRIYPITPNAVEIEGCIFNTPEQVERFIKALQVAKKVVWPEGGKK
jgi:hypothetical protein